MSIYRFSAAPIEGVAVNRRDPLTTVEIFRLLAVHDIGATLLKQDAGYPIDITPPYWDTIRSRYLLTVIDDDNARLDIQSVEDRSLAQLYGEDMPPTKSSYNIPSDMALYPILGGSPSNEYRLHEVIAVLPPGIIQVSE